MEGDPSPLKKDTLRSFTKKWVVRTNSSRDAAPTISSVPRSSGSRGLRALVVVWTAVVRRPRGAACARRRGLGGPKGRNRKAKPVPKKSVQLTVPPTQVGTTWEQNPPIP